MLSRSAATLQAGKLTQRQREKKETNTQRQKKQILIQRLRQRHCAQVGQFSSLGKSEYDSAEIIPLPLPPILPFEETDGNFGRPDFRSVSAVRADFHLSAGREEAPLNEFYQDPVFAFHLL